MRILTQIVRIFVGILFIISGLVKTVDPIGFSYKLEEYFSPDVFNIPFLKDLALPLSIFFVIFEVMLGVLLLLGVWKKFTLWRLWLLIVFFTFLTFYSAYFNKVTDCGCFGDALKLEPWQSFYKDLVLLVLSTFLLFNQKYIKRFIAQPFSYVIGLIWLVACGFIAYWGVAHLPLVDFRAYAVGKNISEGMKTADELGLKPPIIMLKYELENRVTHQKIKVDEEKYLADKHYWEEGSSWDLISTREIVKEKGYTPPIHDFMIDCGTEGDMTDVYLSEPKVVMVITSLPSRASEKGLAKIAEWVQALKAENPDIKILNVSSQNLNIGGVNSCLMDATTLKTMIRSNPGVVFLNKGTVTAKFAWRDLPKIKNVNANF
ncbi:DoxX family membrane protein [Ornithobacterium rhinotracheale]|uniref:BT_3928 family protein n=1 Tax=Ornithobacterium rhinotracheale TaxID=28251 RepID=UPI00129CFD95|nr:BT_3928 family protein [Ornithobacterium rhinotracheale]MRJ11480.1 DoxX family membrane protein [Ornithobacterium rhinotracheale]